MEIDFEAFVAKAAEVNAFPVSILQGSQQFLFLYNEVKAGRDRVFEPVEFGQVMFQVEPD